MVGPVRVDGLVSGIDFTSVIERLLEVQRRPITTIQTQIAEKTLEKNALLEVNISLLSLKGAADALSKATLFSATNVSSSNESSIFASGTSVSALGAFTFKAAQLAQSHQLISNGFLDGDSTAVTTVDSTLTIESGGGFLDRETAVSFLNNQDGIDRGSIRITDSSGQVDVIDLGGVVTVTDVLEKINSASTVSVNASVSGNRLVVRDLAGGAQTLRIDDVGPDATATSLGIAGTGTVLGSDQFIFGSDINTVSGSTRLSLLNDGLGVRRNSDGVNDLEITVRNNTFFVDITSSDDTLDDVITKLNAVDPSEFRAFLSGQGNAIVLEAIQNNDDITVDQINGSFAGVDLGFGVIDAAGAFQAVASEDQDDGTIGGDENRLVGLSLTPGLNSTLRTLLNGGQTNNDASDLKGVSDGTISITDRAGNSVIVDVSQRVGTEADGNSSAGSTSIVVDDTAGFAVGNLIRFQYDDDTFDFRTVTDIDEGNRELFFDKALDQQVRNNDGIYALNDSVEDIVRNLNDRAQAAGVNVRVELNSATNGLRVVDLTGASSSNLIVSGTPANDLGISGDVAASTIEGTDVDPQYLGEETLLSSLNGGDGVSAGKFRVTDTNGISFTVDLSQADDTRLFDVISETNATAVAFGSGVVVSFNDTGDGLVFEDTTPGGGVLQIAEVDNGRTARDLNIAGSAPGSSPAVLNGSFEVSVAIAAGSTLEDIAKEINALSLGVSASVFNDGSAGAPARLILNGQKSGSAGRLTVDSDIAGLAFSTTSRAKDAVLLSGAAGGGVDPAVILSGENQISNVVPGLTLDLRSPGDPVTVTVSRNKQTVVSQAERFVESYNSVIQKIRDFTSFNPDSFETGVLFSDPSIRRIRAELASLVVRPVPEISTADLNRLGEVGIRPTSGGVLTFNSSILASELESNFEQVQSLFILQRRLESTTLVSDLNNGLGIDDAPGDDIRITDQAGTSFDVDIAGAGTVGGLLGAINGASGNPGTITARISSDGFALEIVDSSGGSANGLSVSNVGDATAASQLKIALTLPIGQSVLTGSILGLPNDPGIAQRFSDRLDFITRPGDGLIFTKTESLDESVEDLEETIEKIEARLEAEQNRLIRNFIRLETVIAQSQSQSQQLGALFSGILSAGPAGGFPI